MTIAVHSPALVDEAVAVSALTLAFSSDPAVRWTYPQSPQYLANFPAFIRAFAGKSFEHRAAYTLPGATAAALWLPPGVEPDEEEIVNVLYRSVGDKERPDLFAMFEQMGRAHPAEPHWYLPLIGVDPAQQRKGYGSALLTAGLKICDRDRAPVYLEATNVESIPLYERHGFRLAGVIQAGTSPQIFPMIRKAR